jgi:hypothetical protein
VPRLKCDNRVVIFCLSAPSGAQVGACSGHFLANQQGERAHSNVAFIASNNMALVSSENPVRKRHHVSKYGKLSALPDLPGLVYGGPDAPESIVLGAFNLDQLRSFLADNELTAEEMAAQDQLCAKLSEEALGISVKEIMKRMVVGADAFERLALLRQYVGEKFVFKNKFGMDAASSSGGNTDGQTTVSATSSPVRVSRSDGHKMGPFSIFVTLVNLSNSLRKDTSGKKTTRPQGIVASCSYDQQVIEAGPESAIIMSVIATIYELANCKFYRVNPQLMTRQTPWPGMAARNDPSRKDTESGGSIGMNGVHVCTDMFKVRQWVMTQISETSVVLTEEQICKRDAIMEGAGTVKPANMSARVFARQTLIDALGMWNIKPTVEAVADQDLASAYAKTTTQMELPYIVCMATPLAVPEVVAVPPEIVQDWKVMQSLLPTGVLTARISQIKDTCPYIAFASLIIHGRSSSAAHKGNIGGESAAVAANPAAYLEANRDEEKEQLLALLSGRKYLPALTTPAKSPQLAVCAPTGNGSSRDMPNNETPELFGDTNDKSDSEDIDLDAVDNAVAAADAAVLATTHAADENAEQDTDSQACDSVANNNDPETPPVPKGGSKRHTDKKPAKQTRRPRPRITETGEEE